MANPLICVFNPITTLIDQIASASSGPGVAGSPVVLNSNGLIDPSLVGTGLTAIAGESISGGRLVTLYSLGGTLHMELSYAEVRGSAPPDGGLDRPLPAIGFITSGVAINNTGLVQFSGLFTYVDPNAEFSASDISAEVYLSATAPFSSNGGGITKTRPSGVGQLQQTVGTVVGFTAPNFVQVAFVPLPQPPLLNFSNISTGTNTSATMTVGTGATLTFSGSGVVNANQIQGRPINAAAPTPGQALVWSGADWAPSSGAITAFNDITSGTNITATMTVGTGASLVVSGTGVVEATQLWLVLINSTPPTAGQVLTATSPTAASWLVPGGSFDREQRFGTTLVNAGTLSSMIVCTFTIPFADNNYTAEVSAELGEVLSTAGVKVAGFTKQAAGAGLNVWIENNDSINHNVTVHVFARHD
jgi:hypothetical protein